MAMIRILQYPDPRLKTVGRQVDDFGEDFQKIVDDMFETHYNTDNCAALAATQLDIIDPPHVTVIDFSPEHDQPLCLVNAEIMEATGEATNIEGCMSVGLAGVHEKVSRAAKVKVRAFDRHGKLLEFEAEDFMAKCIQHELDHLAGTIYLEQISKLRRQRVLQRMKKLHRNV